MAVNKARRVGRPRRTSPNPAASAPQGLAGAASVAHEPEAEPIAQPVQAAPERAQRAVSADPAAETAAAAVPKARRRRRGDVGGHKLKLSAPPRAGFVRRWVNDDPGRLPDLQELAYDFVEDGTVRTDGLGSRISRVVGRDTEGKPKLAYLMETPQEEYALGLADKEAGLRAFDEAIRTQRDPTGRLTEDAYVPRDRSTLTSTT